MGMTVLLFSYVFISIYLLVKIDIRLFKVESFIDHFLEIDNEENNEV